jgi:choline dehydrogenase-like flavoprotein
MTDRIYDAVIVGAGPMGALVAKQLSEAGKDVLILEAGRASGLTYEGWSSYVDHYRGSLVKIPNSPYPPNPNAPSPYETTDFANLTPGTPDLAGYTVEMGPLAYGSTYLRSLGGTSLHWLGTCPRMVPNDFRLASTYGVGVDWPIGYDDLQPYYCQAEWTLGVSADKQDQEYFGVHFPADYDYPMRRIPQSWSDQVISKHVHGVTVEFGGRSYPVWVASLPQARNSIPRKGYQPVGAVGAPHKGQRCEGNASCIPICPAQAKYSALKTLAALDPTRVTILTQAVASRVLINENGRIDGIVYKRYFDENIPQYNTLTAKGRIYILAAHAIENAKLLLASGAANSSDQVGRNLMDHPFFITWAMAPMNLGMFRGPGQTSGIPSFRDGEFRREFAAFRIDLGNWGWDVVLPAGSPAGAYFDLVNANVFGPKLRASLGDIVPRQLRIGYVIEQLPEPGNRVTVSREFLDQMGEYRPVIHYNISDYTRLAMVSAMEVSEHVFHSLGITDENIKTHFDASSPGAMTYRTKSGKVIPLSWIGSGHHNGTHRMGHSRTSSVVNRWQQSWDHENLYLVGCGSMPTIGSSNPTLTASALALMASDDMLRQLR